MVKIIKVLSLFDGISCGRVALDKIKIPIERYTAYEIDDFAKKISSKNYPDIEHHGDVFKGDFTQYKGFNLLIGGSPCTSWSLAKKGRETKPEGIGWDLFMEYYRALKESEIPYFLYENNYSIHKDIKSAISEKLGVEPIMINSALFSAQHRKRCYWTNIPIADLPKSNDTMVKDILIDDGIPILTVKEINGKSPTFVASYYKIGLNPFSKYDSERITRQRVAMPIRIGHYGKGGQAELIYSVKGKSVTIKANGGGMGGKTGLYKLDLPDGDYTIRKLYPIEAERLQALPDNYTECEGVSNTQRYKCIGNGWTVDVISHILKGLIKNE